MNEIKIETVIEMQLDNTNNIKTLALETDNDVSKSETDLVKSETCLDKFETDLVKSETDLVKSETDISKSGTDLNNPYAYLEREEFTSEKYKIEIRNLPKYYGMNVCCKIFDFFTDRYVFYFRYFQELRKLLFNKLELAPNKVKTPKARSPWAYVCFRNEEDKTKAIDVITGFKWKGKTLSARVCFNKINLILFTTFYIL